ncbi:hypothetical protein EH223_18970 [candidate division KSB1 bacterium]|nr:hypothetical protein [candidate division KSB1 bacterium]RQW00382.1 MAG: hypothetical protein EH223_18970 [candidate division KSB1 bacterium]
MLAAHDIIASKVKIARRLDLVGGKAQNLAQLALGGFRVPEFFVISTRCYTKRFSLQKKKFIRKLTAALRTCCGSDSERSSFAIRSSSPIEDQKGHSFAGLFTSHLNVKNMDDMFKAIEQIWQSVEQKNVKRYANAFSINDSFSIAIIIQRMIRAQVSGVLFTQNPVGNKSDSMLLEVVSGSCEKLVSGQDTPIQIFIDKHSQAFTQGEFQNTDTKELLSFVREKQNIEQLLHLATEIEHFLGCPQDIEWAFDGQNFWVLQSRPITTLSNSNTAILTDQAGIRWSDYFFAERFVRPLSPLGWSFLQPIIRKAALQTPLWYLGYDKTAKDVQLRLFNGFPRTQLENYQKLYGHIPPSLISADKRETLALTHTTWQPLKFLNYAALLSRLLFRELSWFPPYNLWEWRKWQKALHTKTVNALHNVQQKQIFMDYYRLLVRSHVWSEQFLAIHRWSITFADIFSALLRKFLQKIKIDKKVSVEDLTSGLAANSTMQANKSLVKLNLADEVSLSRFQIKFGHRSESLDIISPTWGEDIAAIKQVSRKAKTARERILANIRHNESVRQQSKTKVNQALGACAFPFNIGLRLIFQLLLHLAQQFTLLRENQRDTWHKILHVTRYSALAMAKIFVEEGKLAQINDIFYLHISEIDALYHAKEISAVHSLVQKRKKEYNQLQKQSEFKSVQNQKNKSESTTALRGIGVSKGSYKGRACIAMNYSQAMQARAGEILVVPCADPGWSPIFSVIGGLVMERGGVLSHASIVAREFRLPAITNVQNATKRIASGDLLEMNGEDGFLNIIAHANRRMSETDT